MLPLVDGQTKNNGVQDNDIHDHCYNELHFENYPHPLALVDWEKDIFKRNEYYHKVLVPFLIH